MPSEKKSDEETTIAMAKALEKAASALEEISETVAKLDPEETTADTWLETRARIGELMARFDQAGNCVSKLLGIKSAQAAILQYLRNHLGEKVGKHALSGVSGIYEWARRIRELRVEQGWPIASDVTRADLVEGEYLLEADAPDEKLAARWQMAKRIRNSGGSGKSRALAYLQEIFPEVADMDQLAYVAKIKSYSRRIRELDEAGHQVVSNVDDPTLPSGAYRLASLELRPARMRQAIKLRYKVLERDKKSCQDCHWKPGDLGPPRTLQIHHTEHRSISEDMKKLVTLCSFCHAGRHAVDHGRTGDELLDPGSDPG